MTNIVDLMNRQAVQVEAETLSAWNNEGGNKRFLSDEGLYYNAEDPFRTLDHMLKVLGKVEGRSSKVFNRLVVLNEQGMFRFNGK